jgi:hypothetical protein
MANWTTTYAIDGTPTTGRLNLDRITAVAIQPLAHSAGYSLYAQVDDYGYPADVSDRTAPFTTLAQAEAAAAALVDTDSWVRSYGSYGSPGIGWIRPDRVSAFWVGSVPGGFYLYAWYDIHGYAVDVSDRTSPFAVKADAVTALDALIGGLP